MVNFTIRSYFPDIWAAHRGDQIALQAGSSAVQDMYLDWYKEVNNCIYPPPLLDYVCGPTLVRYDLMPPRWPGGLLRQLLRGSALDLCTEC